MIGNASPSRRPVERPSTEIVHSLFGAAVGHCWGDFSCSHYRQRGRMYVASNAIGFFSNLFGFERRILLHLDDVKEITDFRTTSIQVITTEGEQYIFKSFENRDSVLLLLVQLKQGHANGSTREAVAGEDGNDVARLDPLETSMEVDEAVREIWKESHTTLETMSSTVHEDGEEQPESPASSTSQTDEEDDNESAVTDGAIAKTPPAPFLERREEDDEENNVLENSTEIVPEDSAALEQEWEDAKNMNEQCETMIDGLVLPCTLDEFFALFLADNAPHSIDAYQRESVGDSELVISPWATDPSDTNVYARVIKFRHPLNNLGMGPNSALTERRHRFRRFGSLGFCLEVTTSVKGVTASDCFVVDDKWIVEPAGETNVTLTVNHHVRFIKRTMLKRIIQTTSNTESQKWYDGYAGMLLSSLKHKEDSDDGTETNSVLPKEETGQVVANHQTQLNVSSAPTNILLLLVLFGCILVGLVFLVLQVLSMNERMVSLENEVSRLREENALALARLAQAIDSLKDVATQDYDMN